MLFIQLFPEFKMKLNLNKNTTMWSNWIKSLRCELEFPSLMKIIKLAHFNNY